MTRSTRPDRPGAPRPPSGRDPYGLLPGGTPIAAVVSVVGLFVVALVTMALVSGNVPFTGGPAGGNGGPGATEDPKVLKTPTPSGLVVVPTEAPGLVIPGTIVYAKDGNIWLQADGAAAQLTNSGADSMPSFSSDGSTVIFVRTRVVNGRWGVDGVARRYHLEVPSVMSIPTAGGSATKLYDGLVDPAGSLKWMGFIQNPVLSPDGKTIAMTTDLPDPTRSDVTLKLLNPKNDHIKDLGLDQQSPLGHQDPAWRPDGKKLAYVRDDRDGAQGTPRISVYDPATDKARALSGPGYLHPAWSPNGRYLAVTKATSFGTDVAILDAASGSEVLRVTSDGDSWGPAWSPAGDQIVFLHVSGQVVDLRLVPLDGSAPSWTPGDPVDLTTNAGLDSVSRPHWFVPADQMPAGTAEPSTEPASPPAASPPAASPAAS